MGLVTGFRRLNSNSTAYVDIGAPLVEKSYLLNRYPELADTFKLAGLWVAGSNYGSFGDSTSSGKVSSPVQAVSGGANWKSVVVNAYGIVHAIKTDGTLWCWGYNGDGLLADGTNVERLSPVQTVSGGTNWKQVSTGTSSAGAIKTDGTLWVWGRNINGELGIGGGGYRSSPVQTVSGGTNWKQVSSGQLSMAAIKTDGTLWCWGGGNRGQLGNNATSDIASPVQTVAGGTNWKEVTLSFLTVHAIKTDGTLWSWGYNYQGQTGDNTNNNNKLSPVQTVSAGTNWNKLVQGGGDGAIKTDGTLWMWGVATNGSLGDGTTLSKSSPVQTVAGGTNWQQVSGGSSAASAAAIKTDGTLWTWGKNQNGQLGDNTIVSKSSPVQTVAGGTNWKQVTISDTKVFIVRDNSSDLFGNSM